MNQLTVTKLDNGASQIISDDVQHAREELWKALGSMADYLYKWQDHIDSPQNITTQEAKTIHLTLEKVLDTYTKRILKNSFNLFIIAGISNPLDSNVDS